MIPRMSWVVEQGANGRTLVVTGEWSERANDALLSGAADGLVLNYARGFTAASLDFIQPAWKLRRLSLLDRSMTDLEPLTRLAPTLEELSVQASTEATLDLDGFDLLRNLAAPWPLIAPTLGRLSTLQGLVTFEGFGEQDLRVLRDHVLLEQLTIKDARCLESLDGVEAPDLRVVQLQRAPRLRDISALVGSRDSLTELRLESVPGLKRVDDIGLLRNLRFLEVGDCAHIDSLAPLSGLRLLEVLYAWGTTEVVDADLTPLLQLPALRELRMRPRRSYKPGVREIPAAVF